MLGGDRDQDTICAVSTPHGVGGISVVRISGPHAFAQAKKIAQFLPDSPSSHKAYFGQLRTVNHQEVIDEVVATYFSVGKSFTGEETVEISCHGNPHICQRILNELISLGLRPADRGEFTYRAFMNDRLDLVQAESVLAVIESQSKEATKQALRQLKGELSKDLLLVEDSIIWSMANIEASIDFSTEDIDVVNKDELSSKLNLATEIIHRLVSSYFAGRILREGLQVALFGRPNVGKSSLLNLFLQEDRAIVTDIPGTTRDVVHGEFLFEGLKFIFLDTAGLRETSDVVEKIGVERSKQAVAEADATLFVFDLSTGLQPSDLEGLQGVDLASSFVLANKSDLVPLSEQVKTESVSLLRKFFKSTEDFEAFYKSRVFFVSAVDKKGRNEVLAAIAKNLVGTQSEKSILVSSARQVENLSRAHKNLLQVRQMLEQSLGAELLAIELKEALIAVQETLGKRFDDQIMDRVFKEFCIGK